MKNSLAITYSIIRDQPSAETGEFANVGIVMSAPETGYFDFLLETRKTSRLTNFFPALETGTLKASLAALESELVRIRTLAQRTPGSERKSTHLFAALTKSREGNIRFSEHRYAFHPSPEQKLKDLFDHYAGHGSEPSGRREASLESR